MKQESFKHVSFCFIFLARAQNDWISSSTPRFLKKKKKEKGATMKIMPY